MVSLLGLLLMISLCICTKYIPVFLPEGKNIEVKTGDRVPFDSLCFDTNALRYLLSEVEAGRQCIEELNK